MATKPTTMKVLRELSEGDARAQLQKLRQELWQDRMKIKDGSLQQAHRLRAARRQIARLETLLGERRET